MPVILLLALREVCEWSTCLASPREHRLSTVFAYGFWSITFPFPFIVLLALLLPLTFHTGRSQGCRGFRSLRIGGDSTPVRCICLALLCLRCCTMYVAGLVFLFALCAFEVPSLDLLSA